MKKLLLLLSISAIAFSVNAQKGTAYGEKMSTKKAVTVTKFKSKLESGDNWTGVVTGKVKEVCKSEGCWLRLDDGSKDGILVKMKDHNFVVPKDIDGKTVYISGVAKKSTTTIEQLKHYAEDAGKPTAEIDAISTPKVEIKMDATGVIVM